MERPDPETAALQQQLEVCKKRMIEQADELRTVMEKLKRCDEQIEYQGSHDRITGLPNRNLLSDRIQQAVSFGRRYRRGVAVIVIDLDHFKLINDSLGHEAGDRLLKHVSVRLKNSLRSIDTVACIGGDKFVVVLTDIKKDEDIVRLVRKTSAAISHPYDIEGQEIGISCSIGISVYPKDGADSQSLLKHADAAMYRAREFGRGSFGFFTEAMNERAVERMRMEGLLRRALEKDELLLYYQPQVDLVTGRMTGMEALLRWRSAELGMVLPAHFIPVAENAGLIDSIGEWVLGTACRQCKAWQDAGFSNLTVSVNLSARQFQNKDLTTIIDGILRETGLDSRLLELEIVESTVMQDVTSSAEVLRKFRGLGIGIALDDFGTGYSSLSYLKRFPFSKLKIDISFVRDITTDPESAAISKAIIAMAHNLNLRVIAEGIETEGQLYYLRNHGCDEMQGFYFSCPLPVDGIERLLNEGSHLEFPADKGFPQRTVLLIDDEPHVLAALRRVIGEEDYCILAATSAAEGFELLAANRVGVVAADLQMPVMNGIEFLGRVKDLYPDILRIVLSGVSDLDTVKEAVNRGAIYKFLNKPWDDEEFREIIRKAFMNFETNKERRS
ncbi:MAG TPA: EAL domain-containing protein [Dissulfurispiraceae bacterium]|nr:EAL domain-containing protein [Dissulfurispiraceae bacterium]